uniref:Uncharacterized protein n=1 Tax=Avena sativa TaxID=4498 RepID=A0ACD5V9H3_AVESA
MATADSAQERGLSAGKSETAAAHGEAVEAVGRKRQARPDAGSTDFRGVRRQRNGACAAQIWHPSRRTNLWIGTFDTAEDAAKAYDAVAVELHGAAAKTNFVVGDAIDVQQVAGLEKAAAGSGFRGVCLQQSGKCPGTFDEAEDAAGAYDADDVRLHGQRAITSFKQPPLDLDFFSASIIPGAHLDDLWTDLPEVEMQPVDELLQDMDFTGVMGA